MNKQIFLFAFVFIFLIGLASATITVTLNSPANGSTQFTNLLTLNASTQTDVGYSIINMSLYDNLTGTFALRNTTYFYDVTRNIAPTASSSIQSGSINKGGMWFRPNEDMNVINVTMKYGVNATTAYIMYNTTLVLASANITGGSAIFNYNLINGTTYLIAVDAGGLAYDRNETANGQTFPVAAANGTWINGSYNGNGTSYWNIGDIYSIPTGSGIISQNVTQTWNNSYTSPIAWGVLACDNSSACQFSNNNTFYSVYVNSQTYNSSTYETASETFTINATGMTTAKLNFDGVNYTVTPSGGIASKTLDMPANVSVKNFYWIVNGLSSATNNITINALNFSICGAAPVNTPYLNISFKNETTLSQVTNASIDSSFVYYLGSGTVNKTYTYSNSSYLRNYTFCSNPANRTLHLTELVNYINTEAPQRTYSNYSVTLTNSTSQQTLYLLPLSLGQYVTFQVVTLSKQTISNVLTTIYSSSNIIESRLTDSAGTATFFLNPLTSYLVTTHLTGYSDTSTTISPTQTSYTITVGGEGGAGYTDYSRGISFTIEPRGRTIYQNTNYNFNITIRSSYYSLDSFGLIITNDKGELLATLNSTNPSGGTINILLNTSLNKTISLEGYYVVNGTVTYIGKTNYWNSVNDTGYSIANFLNHLKGYITDPNDEDGLFGVTSNGTSTNGGYGVTMAILIFLFIFGATGIIGYQYGINQNFIMFGIATFIAYLVEVAFPLITLNNNIPVLTLGLGLVTAVVGIWEGSH